MDGFCASLRDEVARFVTPTTKRFRRKLHLSVPRTMQIATFQAADCDALGHEVARQCRPLPRAAFMAGRIVGSGLSSKVAVDSA